MTEAEEDRITAEMVRELQERKRTIRCLEHKFERWARNVKAGAFHLGQAVFTLREEPHPSPETCAQADDFHEFPPAPRSLPVRDLRKAKAVTAIRKRLDL